MRRLILVMALGLACSGSDPAPSSRAPAASYGLDAAGQPTCDSAATITAETYNGTHQYVTCSWSCASIGGQSGSWRVTFAQAIGAGSWAVYFPDRTGDC